MGLTVYNSIEEGTEELFGRDVYNIYHMLNHLNLFGGMYLREVMRIAGKYL